MRRKRVRDPVLDAVAEFVGRPNCRPNPYHLPGPQPEALTLPTLATVTGATHLACEKSDGERAVLLSMDDGSLRLVMRNMQTEDVGGDSELGHTLLDGEWIRDKRRFLVFDAPLVRGERLAERPLDDRLSAAKPLEGRHGSVEVVLKRFVPASRTEVCRMLETHIQEQADGSLVYDDGTRRDANDGIVFTKRDEPSWSSTGLYKWKRPQDHTVDFRLTPWRDGLTQLMVGTPEGEVRASSIRFDDPYQPGDIVECAFEGGAWVPKRFRVDKRKPNFFTTAFHTVEVLAQRLDRGALLEGLADD